MQGKSCFVINSSPIQFDKKKRVSLTAIRRRVGLDGDAPNGNEVGFIKEPVTEEEEKKLVGWLDWRSRNNMAVDVDVLRNEAKKAVKHKDFKASETWARGVIDRWNIDKGTPQVQDICRARSKTEGAVRAHFDIIHEARNFCYEKNGWDLADPEPAGFIGNGDEKGVVTREHVHFCCFQKY